MKKYLPVFEISLAQEFAYRVNFIMWRVRNIVQILIIYFLWDSVYQDPARTLFGYDRTKMLTYIFGVLILKSIVTSVRSIDVAGEISRGDLVNYLLKPVNIFKYWFTRDLASKALNLFFAVIEGVILYLLLRPELYFPPSLIQVVLFLVALAMAVLLYFLLLMIFASFTFWVAEQAWGLAFLLFVFSDLLGGVVFPIDILPTVIQKLVYLTPFPYLVFMPLQIYLGKFDVVTASKAIVVAIAWVLVLSLALKRIWYFGLRQFRAEGR